VESTGGRYGWAADDPRWTEPRAGGSGRLEPSPPPRFGAADQASPPADDDQGLTTHPDDTPTSPPDSLSFEGTASSRPPNGGQARPLTLPPWPPPPPVPDLPVPAAGPTVSPLPRRDLFGPPLAITAAPVSPPPTSPPVSPPSAGPVPPFPPADYPSDPDGPTTPPAAPASTPAPTWLPSAVPTPIPLRLQTRPSALPGPTAGSLPGPTGVELRTGYGLGTALTTGASTANGGTLARDARPTRLERRVRIRSRWRADDEFRQAGRAELFSDDARYQVVFTLTALWYVPVAVIGLLWVLLVSGEGTLGGILSGLGWLAFAAGVSMAIAGLLRWASVGWRAITLSIASALIGGGLTTIAYTLTG